MMGKWRESTLGDLLDVKHGFAFRGEYFADAGSHVVLTPGNFEERGGFRSKGEKEKWYTGPIPAEYVLRKGDVLIAMTEQAEGLLGSSAIVPSDKLYLHNQRLGLVQARDADLGFLYHLFNSPSVRQQIRATASGTKVRHTSPSRIADVRIRVPGLPEQRRIAGILSDYGALIENCERRIHVLDEMARALYQEWFVLFRYPGNEKTPLVQSALGRIPRGWALAEVASLANGPDGVQTGPFGSQLHQRDYSHEGVPVVMPKDLRGFRIDETDIARVPEPVAQRLGRHRMAVDDIVYGRRGDIGRRAFVMEHQEGAVCGTGCLRVRPDRNAIDGWYLFQYLGREDVVALISGRAHGVTMPNLNTKLLATVPVVVPPRQLQDEFRERSFPLAVAREKLVSTAANLRKTRDLLLPRLLSGRLPLGLSGRLSLGDAA
jgi:type I restriction enzyme S subunit